MKFFLCVIGMVMIVEGLPYFAFPDKMKQVVEQILKKPDCYLRWFGSLLMFAGLLFIYIGRN